MLWLSGKMEENEKIVQITFRSTFFFKDSLEWNRFYKVLSNIEKVDKTKLVYLAMLSVETLLKAIILLWLPIELDEKWIKKYLKEDLNHLLFNTYIKIQRDILPEEQKNLLKSRDTYSVEIRYSTDALFEWLEIKWLQSNRKPQERERKNKKLKKELEIYEALYSRLLLFYKSKVIELDPERGQIFFEAMSMEKYSLWVSNNHHNFYRNEYFKKKKSKK